MWNWEFFRIFFNGKLGRNWSVNWKCVFQRRTTFDENMSTSRGRSSRSAFHPHKINTEENQLQILIWLLLLQTKDSNWNCRKWSFPGHKIGMVSIERRRIRQYNFVIGFFSYWIVLVVARLYLFDVGRQLKRE